jgi:dipeptidyl aminopeptidase/acylaminoacyl peptidase
VGNTRRGLSRIASTTAAAAVLALALTAAALGAQAPSTSMHVPITHEKLWLMKRVGAPAVSPDGKWVVFAVLEPAYEADKEVSDLWIVSCDGSAPPRRLTNTRAPENGVDWSPDSRSIAFVTKREGDEVEQLYVLDLALGGEARRLTELSSAVANPKWSPDGKRVLFETLVYPGALDDEANRKSSADYKARKYNLRVYEHFPVRYWNQWIDERQLAIEVVSLEPGAKPKDILSATTFAHTAGFAGVDGETSASLSPIWSPDGSEIVFTATTERWNAAFADVGYHLYRMPSSGGAEPRPVTPARGHYEETSFAPDGKSLFFKYAPLDAEDYHLQRLSKVAWPSAGQASVVARDFDHEVAVYAISPDSRIAMLLVPEAGKENVYRVSTSGGTPTRVIEPAVGGYTSLVAPRKARNETLIAAYGSSTSPLEIVRLDPAARTHTNLTHFATDAAAEIDWQPPEHFYFTSAKGRRHIHNMIVRPPAFDPARKYPLLVLIHGGPAAENPDQIGLRWNYHLLSAPGYVLLMTDYSGSTGFGEKFSQAIKLDPLRTPGDEINQAVDEALKRFAFIDASRMCAAGASYGGHLANWLEATTTRFRCLVSHAGEVDLLTQWGESDSIYHREVVNGGPPWETNPIWREQSPISYAARWQTPMLLSIGERDFRVPIGNTLENWSTLQRMHVPSRLLVWPDAWHWILKAEDSRRFYEEVHRWLAYYLKGEGTGPAAPVSSR